MMIRTMRICFMWSSKSLALGLVLVKSAIAAPVDLQCPAPYPDRQQWTNLQKQGWLMLSDHQGRPVLVEAGVLVGDATGNGELRGADLAMGAGRQFGFAGTETDGAKWFYCHYGTGAGVRLAYQLPVSVKHCRTVERLAGRQLVQASIRCE